MYSSNKYLDTNMPTIFIVEIQYTL